MKQHEQYHEQIRKLAHEYIKENKNTIKQILSGNSDKEFRLLLNVPIFLNEKWDNVLNWNCWKPLKTELTICSYIIENLLQDDLKQRLETGNTIEFQSIENAVISTAFMILSYDLKITIRQHINELKQYL